MVAALQYSAHLQMQLQIGAKHQRAATVSMATGEDNSAAAGRVAGVNSGLDGCGVIGHTVADGAE
jgi:hypothetical protein